MLYLIHGNIPTEEHTIDKSDWPEGPWRSEADIYAYFDDETGYPCMVMRHGHMGTLNGYVGIPDDHPCFGVDHDDMPDSIDVYGGLTFSSLLETPNKLGREVHWFGFDCAHHGDMMPGVEALLNRATAKDKVMMNGCQKTAWRGPRAAYRDIDFVKNEVRRLARQLKDQQWLPAEAEPPA